MIKVFDEDKLVTIFVLYYMPDHVHLVNEFTWQTHDTIPQFPRSVKFIRFWHTDIDAIIKEAHLEHTTYWGGTDYVDLKGIYDV